MEISIPLLIFVLLAEYLAIQKDNKKGRCNHKFADRDTSSQTAVK